MKFLKSKTLSNFSISDRTLIAYPDANGPGARVVMNAHGGLMLPKGSTSQRPQLTGVRQPTDANGTIRYNTTTSSIEAYVGGAWEVVRAPGSATITKQTLGPGNDVDVDFGPLTLTPSSADNIIVLVENVMQISVTNFNLISGNTVIRFTSPVPTGKYVTVYFGFAN